ncbi:unnamed protein product [Thelazia callipaeda]|uniref:CID domain-containing protein n=1 Tax=Thelazia callipaeda TaxID=103827 RepID=A0A0N5CPE9_THECL|nr:unnamed protein product [Thelazia callipaeda]
MALSDEVISRRLRAVDQTSESIQTTSMWILHHRDSAVKFVNCWNEVFKTANDVLQIALFYVANDVCQKAKKKNGAHILLQAFAPHWVNAISYSRGSENVQKAVSRILDIFEERQIYSKSQLADMRAAQNDSNELEDNSLLDFDINYLIRDVEGYHKGNLVMERARELLSRSDFNFKDKIMSRMKDRRDGIKFMEEMEQSHTKLMDFYGALAKHRKRGQQILGEIERAKRCFTLQLRDVTVVEDHLLCYIHEYLFCKAYQKFGSGIDEVSAEVEEMLKTGVYPGASPPRDAPSPTANDDPFREGVETAFKQMRGPQNATRAQLPLPKSLQCKEESVVTADSLQTNQSFKGSVHMLKIMEGIRANETSKTMSSSSVVSDPRLASHSFSSNAVSLSIQQPTTTVGNSSVSLKQQISTSSPTVSGINRLELSSLQYVNPSAIAQAATSQNKQTSLPNGSLSHWMHNSSLSDVAHISKMNAASVSRTISPSQATVISSQHLDIQTKNTASRAAVFERQSSSLSQIEASSRSDVVPITMPPPPPPNASSSQAMSLISSFASSGTQPHALILGSSTPPPSVIPLSSNSFNIPPPVALPRANLIIPPPGVVECPLPLGNFTLASNVSSPAGSQISRSLPSSSPSSSSTTAMLQTNEMDSGKMRTNGGNSNVDSMKQDNGDVRNESKKSFDNYNSASEKHGDHRLYSGLRCEIGGYINRENLRGRDRDRDRERNDNRGLLQSYDDAGRRYSTDNRSRMFRYRDYENDRRSRRYETLHSDLSRNRR